MYGFTPKTYNRDEIKKITKAVYDEMYSVENTLKRRGYIYVGDGDLSNIILPKDEIQANEYFNHLDSRTFRNILKKCINKKQGLEEKDFKTECNQDKLQQYLGFLENAGILTRNPQSRLNFSLNINNFGHTFEWYVAELFNRKLGCTAGWGIRIEDIDTGGDFDVLARVETSLAYVETKSTSPNNIKENDIRHFLHRDQQLDPDMSIFLVDTRSDLSKLVSRFSDIITDAEIKQHKRNPNSRHEIKQPAEIPGIYIALRRVFIINSEPSILNKLRRCLKYYFTILPNLTYFSREGRLSFITR